MGTLTIRNVDDAVIAKLKERTKTNHRSLEAELRVVLQERAAMPVRQAMTGEELAVLAEQIAARTRGIPQTDSAVLIREDRDR